MLEDSISNQNNVDQGISEYAKFMYGGEKFNLRWFYEVKDVDRRLSYSLVRRSSKICDVGGAKGIDAFAFAKKGAFVVNVDIEKSVLKEGKELAGKSKVCAKLNFIRASATNLPFKNQTFDLVTCFSTIDHLPDKRSVFKAISEFYRVVRQSGHVAVTVPNKAFIIGTIIMKLKNLTNKESFFEQRFTPKELFQILHACGLKPIAFDSEFPKSVGFGLLYYNFPKICRKIPGIMTILSFGAYFFRKISKMKQAKLFGARMGYLSEKAG